MKIAIAGLIASGKSTVLKEIASAGHNVISLDDINKALLRDSSYIKVLQKYFPEVVSEEGVIQAGKLKKLIFENNDKRLLLNSISHPKIENVVKEILRDHENVFVEVPLIIEANMSSLFDQIWAIYATEHVRLKRILKRDIIDIELAQKIINSQDKEIEVYKIATKVIYNNRNEITLSRKIKKLLNDLAKNQEATK